MNVLLNRFYGHRSLRAQLLASGACFAPDDGGTLDVVELEESLADVEKPAEVTAGLYTAEIQDVQKRASGAGNDYYAVKFVIPASELPADIAEQYDDGAILYWNRQLVPKKGDRRALFNLRKFIEAIGLDANTTTIDPNEWMGRTARIRVKMGSWNGEPRAEIAAVEAAEKVGAARGSAKPAATKGRGGKR